MGVVPACSLMHRKTIPVRKWSGNTHLFIFNRAVEILASRAQDAPSTAAAIAAYLNEPVCKKAFAHGLWAIDDKPYREHPVNGAHAFVCQWGISE